MAKRPVFNPDLGQFFARLRGRLGLRQAATIAENKRLRTLTRSALSDLEKGKRKNVEPEMLRDLATLYGLPYDVLVRQFVSFRYGVPDGDLVRHASEEGSALHPGGADVPASARILELEQQLRTYETALSSVEDVAKQLIDIAAVREKGGTVAATPPRRRRRS